MATNEELQAELHQLRAELSQLQGPVPEAARQPLSRRNLLRAAPIVAVGGALAARSATPASAAVGQAVLQGEVNNAGTSTTTLNGGTPWEFGGVDITQPAALAVNGGIAGDWITLQGITVGSTYGAALIVEGDPEQGLAAKFTGTAVPVSHGDGGGDAVLIEATGPGNALTIQVTDGLFSPPGGPATDLPSTGISVLAASGPALDATGSETVVAVKSTDTGAQTDAVTIAYAGRSRAFYAESTNATNINGTVTGVNDGHGTGVWGEQRNNTGTGFGVVGVGGAQGRGARLSGGAAALQMLPSAAATHPSTGKAGDFFVDASVRLWFCQKPSSGAVAAVWRQIA